MKNETRGMWTDIEPHGLSRKHREHPWHFAHIHEAPSQRTDDNWYSAFVFRDDARAVFGLREWLGQDLPHHQDIRRMATRVVMEKSFRNALLTGDPEVKQAWKKH